MTIEAAIKGLLASMPPWLDQNFFIMKNSLWIALFATIILCHIFERIIVYYSIHISLSQLEKKEVLTTHGRVKKLKRPIALLAFSSFWLLAIKVVPYPEKVITAFVHVGQIVFTVAIIMTLTTLTDYLALFFEKKAKASDNKFDDILVPLIRKSLKFFIILIGVVFIGNSLTLDMKGLVAGLGLGGFAFAFAAKDTIGNIFGSLTVLLDRPFRIGDWITLESGVSGIIEEVGLRSTRIRTFYDSLITVPNGQLTNVSIDNFGQRQFRRFKTNIGVQYDTDPALLEMFAEEIRKIIKETPKVRKDTQYVYFNNMGAYSLDILIYIFFEVADYEEELQERHKLLMTILKRGNEMGVQFAFPTQTLHLQGQPQNLPPI